MLLSFRRLARLVLPLLSVALFMGAAGIAAALSLPASAATTPPPRPLTDSGNAFALVLYQELVRNTDLLAENKGNLFFSPFSIHTALAMVWHGAAGDTAQQMTTTLRLQPGIALGDFQHQLAAITAPAADGKPAYELATANGLWGQHEFPFSPDYLRLLKDVFAAGFAAVDFAKDAAGIAAEINAWVAGKTRDKIKDLIPPSALNQDTRLVLVNAIYFKGKWLEQFDKAATRDAAFHLSATEKIDVPMMHHTPEQAGYFESETVKVLELGYLGGDVSMVVVLPKAVDGLAAVEAALNAEDLGKWLGIAHRGDVIVALPRFKFLHRFSLVKIMANLGMIDAFLPDKADLSKMLTPAGWQKLVAAGKRLIISAIIHMAFVAVDEEGTEAAAATAVAVLQCESVAPPPPQFIADHPFLFMIRHKPTGRILFMGRVADPRG